MAFSGTATYTLTFADVRGRTHVIYIDEDGTTPTPKALTPTEDPVIYKVGASRQDEYTPLMPSVLEINYMTGLLDGVVDASLPYDAIVGDTDTHWRVRWEVAGTEVWRGFLITDEMDQPLDTPAVGTLRASCGLAILNNIEQTEPAAPTTRISFIEGIADAINSGISGSDLTFSAAANWHAYIPGVSPPTTALESSGNSWEKYAYSPHAFSNWERPTAAAARWDRIGLIIDNLVGRFGGRIVQAAGKWRLFQRALLNAASYTAQTYDSAGAADSSETIDDFDVDVAAAPIMYGGIKRSAPPYGTVTLAYDHGDVSTNLGLNASWFGTWTDSVPRSWTFVDETSGGSEVASDWLTEQSLLYDYFSKACLINAYDGTVNDPPAKHALIGLSTESLDDIENDYALRLDFDVQVFSSGTTPTNDSFIGFPVFWSLWINDTQDYYWNNTTQAWVAGSIASPPAAAKNPAIPEHRRENSFSYETAALSTVANLSGTVKLILYGVVDTTSKPVATTFNPTGSRFRHVRLSAFAGTGTQSKRTVSSLSDTLGTLTHRPTQVFKLGQGPSLFAKGCITHAPPSAVGLAEDWKLGSYDAGESVNDTGRSLDYVHAKAVMTYRNRSVSRLRVGFRIESGTDDYWPHRTLVYDSSRYTCVELSHSVRNCEYLGEWLHLQTFDLSLDTPVVVEDEGGRDIGIVRGVEDESRVGPPPPPPIDHPRDGPLFSPYNALSDGSNEIGWGFSTVAPPAVGTDSGGHMYGGPEYVGVWNDDTLTYYESGGTIDTVAGLVLGRTTEGWGTYMASSGNFYLGGTSGWLTWDAANNALVIKGSITITGGSGIASLTDAGALAILDSVNATYIDDNSVTTNKIFANAVTTSKIAAGAVTANEISVTNLQAVSTTTGALTVDGALTMTTGSMQSNVYTAGSAGWQIQYDGSAEFNDVTVRGALASGSIGSTVTFDGGSYFKEGASSKSLGVYDSDDLKLAQFGPTAKMLIKRIVGNLDLSLEGRIINIGINNTVWVNEDDTELGFHNATPIAKPTVTGSRGGNAALASLLTALANYGLITDSSS